MKQVIPACAGMTVGLAVSGGGDSLALFYKMLESGVPKKRMVVLHYNHKWSLWGDIAEKYVRKLCRDNGIKCVVGKGKGKAKTNAEAKARAERYAFFARESKRLGLDGVMVAHTLDDQVETFFIRLARGSGLTGLSGMTPDSTLNGVRILRPLLAERRADLRTYLRAKKIRWLDDPSNEETDGLRVRIRTILPALAKAGVEPLHIAASMASLARANDGLNWVVEGLADDGLSHEMFMDVPDDIAQRLLARALRGVQPEGQLPRLSQRLAAVQAIRAKSTGKISLGHAFVVWGKGKVRVVGG